MKYTLHYITFVTLQVTNACMHACLCMLHYRIFHRRSWCCSHSNLDTGQQSTRCSRNKTNNAQRTQCTHLFQADAPNQMLQNSRIFSRSLVVSRGFTWRAAREECEIDECFTLLVVPKLCSDRTIQIKCSLRVSGRRRVRTFMIDVA